MFSITKLQSFIFLSVFILFISVFFVLQAQTSSNIFNVLPTASAFGGGGGDGGGGGGGGGCGGCGGSTGDDGGGGGYEPTPAPTPTCSLSVSPGSLPAGGGQVTVSWSSNNVANDSTLWIGGTEYTSIGVNSGSKTVHISNDTSFRFDIWNETGSDTCSATVTVADPAPTPTCSLSVSPGSLPAGGGQVTVSWSSNNVANDSTLWIGGTEYTSIGVNSGSKTVHISNDTSFRFDIWNETGSKTCSATVTVADPDPLPECVINASPSSITRGNSSNLVWTTTNAESASINQNVGRVSIGTNRSVNVSPNYTTTYTLTVTNGDGEQATCHTTITVNDVPADPLPECVINASPSSITRGNSSNLVWTTTNAESASINQSIGSVSVGTNRVQSVSPTNSTTYTLTVTNGDGEQATCHTSIIVNNVPADPLPECVINASPSSITRGNSSNLVWTTTNAESASINQSIGSVSVGTNRSRSVSPTNSTTYTMTVTNGDGEQATCHTTIDVSSTPTPTPFTCDDITFRTDRSSLPRGGGDVEFTWDAEEADSVSIPRLQTTALSGEDTIRITSTERIVLNATKDSTSISCPIRVTVDTGGGGGGSSAPRCELDISDRTITAGEDVTLTWDSSRAADIKITDNHGETVVTTHDRLASDKEPLFDGSITLQPTEDTTYTMVAERGSRDDECEVSVTVDGEVVVQETRNQEPVVAGIALTQVPYTGFEAGPMLTAIFYILLVVWGLFVAYVFVIRRSQLGGVSLPNSHGYTSVSDVTTASLPYSDMSEAESYVATTASAPTNLPTATAPSNLPTAAAAPVVGYANQRESNESDRTETPSSTEVAASMTSTELENRAHMQKALFSSDAMRYLIANTDADSRDAELDRVILTAKNQYPSENGWVVINHERIENLLGNAGGVTSTVVDDSTPTKGGSLAEAIATHNLAAAYQMIAHRPMVALADAATEFDGVIRNRNGVSNGVSAMLADATEQVSEANIREAIHALTSALDGVYTNEEEAVKMAILKAVKALN